MCQQHAPADEETEGELRVRDDGALLEESRGDDGDLGGGGEACLGAGGGEGDGRVLPVKIGGVRDDLVKEDDGGVVGYVGEGEVGIHVAIRVDSAGFSPFGGE